MINRHLIQLSVSGRPGLVFRAYYPASASWLQREPLKTEVNELGSSQTPFAAAVLALVERQGLVGKVASCYGAVGVIGTESRVGSVWNSIGLRAPGPVLAWAAWPKVSWSESYVDCPVSHRDSFACPGCFLDDTDVHPKLVTDGQPQIEVADSDGRMDPDGVYEHITGMDARVYVIERIDRPRNQWDFALAHAAHDIPLGPGWTWTNLSIEEAVDQGNKALADGWEVIMELDPAFCE